MRDFGIGICARREWDYGCDKCEGVKAWSYTCRNTLWHAMSEAVRPKAKPKGRPKKC